MLTESGIFDRRLGTQMVDYPAKGKQTLSELELPEAGRFCIAMSLELLLTLGERKEMLRREIYRTGRPLDDQVRLLMGIRGITALLALAFLVEVGDIRRFKSLRGMNAYLGVVPTVRSSGGITHTGHITRQSRSLARTLFTQAVYHISNSSPSLRSWYDDLAHRKGRGRARIAMIRKTFGMMRRMLLSQTPYRWIEPELYQRKIKVYEREMKKTG